MKSKQAVAKALQDNHDYLAATFGVKRIGLFGSFASERFGATSDVDLVVEFETPIGLKFVELVEYLEALLGRKVDVLTPAGIESIRVPRVATAILNSIEYV